MIGRDLSDREIDILFAKFRTELDLLAAGNFPQKQASKLIQRISLALKSSTIALSRNRGYYFDGPIPNAFGQIGTALHYVLKDSIVLCAKIGAPAVIGNEAAMVQELHNGQVCPTVMPFVDCISMKGDRQALITPCYSFPVGSFVGSPVSLNFIINAALCGLATIKSFSNKNICHGDIKPANMMLTTSSPTVITIDFGSAVPYGEDLSSVTQPYGLDCSLTASLEYDLTCLAYSIVELVEAKETSHSIVTRDDLRRHSSGIPDNKALTIAALCVSGDDIDKIADGAFAICLDLATGIVRREHIWPRYSDESRLDLGGSA
jgi:serine/threonine protein kinase